MFSQSDHARFLCMGIYKETFYATEVHNSVEVAAEDIEDHLDT
jgi:hypothetical protein